jgi:hypothetical protein
MRFRLNDSRDGGGMALHSRAHADFRRSIASRTKHSPQKRSKTKWATEELVLWAVLIVAAVALVGSLLSRAC